MKWIDRQIENAAWWKFAAAFAALFAYSFWAFRANGAFGRARAAAGPLPEELFGLHPGQPMAAFSKLGELQSDYLFFQALDVPYALFTALATFLAMALAVKAFGRRASPLRYAILAPLIYLAAEAIENPILAAGASGMLDPAGIAGVQQIVTTVKHAAGFAALILGLVSVLAAGVATLLRRLRRPSDQQ